MITTFIVRDILMYLHEREVIQLQPETIYCLLLTEDKYLIGNYFKLHYYISGTMLDSIEIRLVNKIESITVDFKVIDLLMLYKYLPKHLKVYLC